MKPQAEQPQKCPRCDSLNTKFCYYNNYSLTQPRYFCKTCRRYWTKGGTLRNVPVGGGCRKGKRSNRGGSSDHSISPSFQDKQVIATTSSPGSREGMIGTKGEDGHAPAAPVYYSGDHGGFNNYSAATAARVQLHMIDQQASSSSGDDNKLSILPSLAALESFNHATNLGDFSSIFYPRGHHHHLPTTPPTETFQTPPLFNLPVVQGLNNGSNHWRLQQEHTNFSPPAATAAAATGQQQHRPLDAHIGRDGPLHLLPVDENVFPGLRNHQKLVHHVSLTATAGAPYSSVKTEETTGVSRQDWQVQSESNLENATNPFEGVTAAVATGYWNNGCSSSPGPSPHWPDLSRYGPPSSFL